jgi:hypothetical protein
MGLPATRVRVGGGRASLLLVLREDFAELGQTLWLLCLAFPNHEYGPAVAPEAALVEPITLLVAADFPVPVRTIGFWRSSAVRAFRAAVPEATVDE